jgi:serine/threonine-protein kinase
MDFGIARAIADSSSTMTQTAAVVGTAQYLSPEQARGETVDSRSDVYSTGCLLYELLTGRPPFVGESPVSVAYQHVREQAAPPSSLDPELPPEVDAIVMKALAKRIEDRYQSASAMRSDIERFLAGKPVVAPAFGGDDATSFMPGDDPDGATSIFGGAGTATEAEEEQQQRKRWPLILLAVGILVLLIAAIVFGSSLFSSAPQQKSVPELQMLTKTQAQDRLKGAGLKLGAVRKQASQDVPKGKVMAQDPNQGSLVKPGSAVDITLSTGKPNVVVPYVIGEQKNAAVQELQSKHLKAKLVKRQSDQTRGIVIDTNPNPAESVSKGSVVTVYYSAGPTKVPNVVGMSAGQAEQVLTAAGFRSHRVTDSTSTAPPGTVTAQSPPAFTRQPQGTTITITVAGNNAPPPPTPTPTTSTPTPTPTPTPSSSPSSSFTFPNG